MSEPSGIVQTLALTSASSAFIYFILTTFVALPPSMYALEDKDSNLSCSRIIVE
jgi:hypothetical protein